MQQELEKLEKIFYLEAEEIADKTRREVDGVADNFTEGDGGARETREVRAREADKTRREVDGVADNFTERAGGARETDKTRRRGRSCR